MAENDGDNDEVHDNVKVRCETMEEDSYSAPEILQDHIALEIEPICSKEFCSFLHVWLC